MAKKVLALALVVALVFVFSGATPVKKQVTDTSVKVMSPAVSVSSSDIAYNVMKARFENMLNRNYLYDDDFSSDQTVIENSILALLDKSVDGEIDKNLVLGFITGMYGLQVDPAAAEYDFAPASEGKFLILPRGYSEYSHTITSITEEVGGYTVNSDMLIMAHDGEEYTVKVTTVFVPNEGSSFGYNIISSNIA